MNFLFNILEDEKSFKKKPTAPLIPDECYKNGYHPSRWELAEVFLNGIWKPYKFNSIMKYKSRERLTLQVDTQCPNAIFLDDTTNKEISLYELFENNNEIHPADEWYIGNDQVSLCYKQPTTMSERREVIKGLKEYAPFVTIPFLIDKMDNNFNVAYDAVPERLYVLENKQFKYIGGPGPFGFKPEEVYNFLSKKFKSYSKDEIQSPNQ